MSLAKRSANSIAVEESVELVSSPEKVWPLIVDTDRMNRLMGLAPVKYEAIAKDSRAAARFSAETRIGGFRMTYEESPYEWTEGKEFGVYRKCTAGPLEYIAMRWTLEPGNPNTGGYEGGAHLTVRFESEAKFALLRPIAWLGGRATVKNLIHLGERIDSFIREQSPNPYLEPISESNVVALASAAARLKERGVRKTLADRLEKFVSTCADADAIRMRPFELADEWNEPRREVLAAFLQAVPAGLVELRWAIVCPSCLTASAQVPSLDRIGEAGHCQFCDIAFELDLDRAVEATFFPHPVIRQVPDMMFCIGGPARTPHVVVQTSVDATGERRLEVPTAVGRYRIFSRGGGRATLSIVEEGPREATVSIKNDHIEPVTVTLGVGAHLLVRNETDEARHVKIERLAYASAAATAHDVSTMEEFRNVFSGDLLKRGTPLKVARVAVLFSDLTGSTALYSQVGDAAAFRLVDDHFDVLRVAIKEHDGVIVKTMGDAIMASFTSEKACTRAAVACLKRFEQFRKEAKNGDATHIKLGLFSGPCYVITANGSLDYFGQTVNVASRLQHLAESGEIVMLEEEKMHLEGDVKISDAEEVRVKGVDHLLRIVRVKLA